MRHLSIQAENWPVRSLVDALECASYADDNLTVTVADGSIVIEEEKRREQGPVHFEFPSFMWHGDQMRPVTDTTAVDNWKVEPEPAADADTVVPIDPEVESEEETFQFHDFVARPQSPDFCQTCGLSAEWREHGQPEPAENIPGKIPAGVGSDDTPEATADNQLETQLTESVKTIDERRHVCDDCDRAFATPQGVASHRRLVHQGGNPSPPKGVAQPGETHTPLEEAKHRWNQSRRDTENPKIAGHAHTEPADEKPYACKCGLEFDMNSDLADHLNSKDAAANRKQHHIVRQPRAAIVPSGIPPRIDENGARRAAFTEVGPEHGA